jgi:hypothetical protein
MKAGSRTLMLAAAVAAVLGALGCTKSSSEVALGKWGGRNAELVVTSAGATARFKCGATGTIGQRLTLDAGEAFDVPGSFVTPVINLGVQPARYVGSVSGSSMALSLSVSDQPGGSFQLTLGAEPSFDPCNF